MSAPTKRRSAEQLREDLLAIWNAGVQAVDSKRLVQDAVFVEDDILWIGDEAFSLVGMERILVVGGGKAGAGMAAGLEAALGSELLESKSVSGLISVPADCVRSLQAIKLVAGRPAGVNEPQNEGVAATRQMLQQVSDLNEKDLCICLLSGGGSALLPAPAKGISLEQKQTVAKCLSASGANINELNTVRKQLSQIKGGGLAAACSAGQLVTLVISDVLGDPLDIIASGPTVENSTNRKDAIAILKRYGSDSHKELREIADWMKTAPETHHSSKPKRICNIIIGNNALAVDAAGMEAERRGYSHAMVAATKSEGIAETVGNHLAKMAIQMRDNDGPDCLITGGEPTVVLTHVDLRGKGGRNQQLTLAAYSSLANEHGEAESNGIAIISGGTDGEDGPTDAAGAFIDIGVAQQIEKSDLNVSDHLERNDAYTLFAQTDGLVRTGPTHTNVCDLRVVVVDRIQDS